MEDKKEFIKTITINGDTRKIAATFDEDGKNIKEKFQEIEENTDDKLAALEANTDDKLSALDEQTTAKLQDIGSVSVVKNLTTNLNGFDLYNFKFESVEYGSYTVKQLRDTESMPVLDTDRVKTYMKLMTGRDFYHGYDYDSPTNDFFITTDDFAMWKMQYDDVNGLLAFKMMMLPRTDQSGDVLGVAANCKVGNGFALNELFDLGEGSAYRAHNDSNDNNIITTYAKLNDRDQSILASQVSAQGVNVFNDLTTDAGSISIFNGTATFKDEVNLNSDVYIKNGFYFNDGDMHIDRKGTDRISVNTNEVAYTSDFTANRNIDAKYIQALEVSAVAGSFENVLYLGVDGDIVLIPNADDPTKINSISVCNGSFDELYVNTKAVATKEDVYNLIDGAPDKLNTLNELAAALNDNENAYNTLESHINNSINKIGSVSIVNSLLENINGKQLTRYQFKDLNYFGYPAKQLRYNDAEEGIVYSDDVASYMTRMTGRGNYHSYNFESPVNDFFVTTSDFTMWKMQYDDKYGLLAFKMIELPTQEYIQAIFSQIQDTYATKSEVNTVSNDLTAFKNEINGYNYGGDILTLQERASDIEADIRSLNAGLANYATKEDLGGLSSSFIEFKDNFYLENYSARILDLSESLAELRNVVESFESSAGSITLVQNLNTNINGYYSSAYKFADYQYGGGYKVKQLQDNETSNVIFDVDRLKSYMKMMTGNDVYHSFDYTEPINDFFICVRDFTLWKIQYDEENGLLAFFMAQLPTLNDINAFKDDLERRLVDFVTLDTTDTRYGKPIAQLEKQIAECIVLDTADTRYGEPITQLEKGVAAINSTLGTYAKAADLDSTNQTVTTITAAVTSLGTSLNGVNAEIKAIKDANYGGNMLTLSESIADLRTDMENAFTPGYIGQATSNPNTYGYIGFGFNVSGDNTQVNGLYMFTYGNSTVLLPIYNITRDIEYKTAAALLDESGGYRHAVLTYVLTDNGLFIYQKEGIIPRGYTGYLFKIKLN